MFRVVLPPIIRSACNCIYSIWYLLHRYCYLPLSWKSWNRFECSVAGVRHPQHTQTGSNSSTIAADSSNGVTNTRCFICSCMRSWYGWKYHPKHVEQFPDIIKLCNVASCWIYIGVLLGAHPTLHISRISVKETDVALKCLADFPSNVIWSAIRLKRKTFSSKLSGDFTLVYYKK
jgi:hypothetical protein